ncbi:hypothetical protein BDW75DRAFT_249267 [Aspergillus navahoensis]
MTVHMGAGFIGSHLVQHLLDHGHRVLVFDSLWTGTASLVDKFQSNDINEPVDQIYHLACPASPDQFEETPVQILETCFRGTKNILDLAMKHRARVLIASTSEIYGDPKVIPQPENYWGNVNSFGPRSCYDEGKRISEALAYAYKTKHCLEIRIARIFNTYGPHMRRDDGRAVPNFITAAIDGRPMVVYGDGNATRCFQYVSDCVAGLVRLMQSDYDLPVNIGSNSEIRVREFAEMVAQAVAAKTGTVPVPINYLPARQDDPERRKPDISIAQQALRWEPVVPLQEGLERSIEWFLAR